MHTLQAILRPLTLSAHCLCALAFFVLAAPMCAAAAYYVSPSGSDSNSGDRDDPYMTIQAAINHTSPQGADTVILENGTYSGDGDTDVSFQSNSAITITSENGPTAAIIDCSGTSAANHRAFFCSGNVNVIISNLTIKGGYETAESGGAIYVDGGNTAYLQNCTLANNTAQSGGAAQAYGPLTLNGCRLTGNSATADGGAVYDGGAVNGVVVTLSGCTFSGNSAAAGGAASITGTVTNCGFTNNTATMNGGAVSGAVKLTGCTLTGNSAASGGAVSGTGTVTNCAFTSNTATGDGGGFDGSGTLTGCTFTGNSAGGNGGGAAGTIYSGNIYVGAGTVGNLTTCAFNSNTAGVSGGGFSGSGTLTGCTFTSNTSASGGGVSGGGTLTNCTFTGNLASLGDGGGISGGGNLTGCAFSGNAAMGNGGGMDANSSAVLNMTNCTFTGNFAFYGGGLFNSGLAALNGCTFTSNSAPYSFGGGLYNSGNTLILTNSIFTNNNAESGGGGIFGYVVQAIRIANCVFDANTSASPNGYGGGVALEGDSTETVALQYCTFTGNFAGATGGGLYHGYSGPLYLTDDIFYGDRGNEITDDTADGTSGHDILATFCDVQGGYSGTSNINADPLFVNPAAGDFHLKPGSPAVGAGTPIFRIPTDFDGKARANPPSLGAYEGTTGGHTHLLWNNSDGRVMLWSVAPDGAYTLNGFGPYTDGSPSNVWTATAVATGADGKSHLLWNNTDGRVMLWTVDDAGNFTLAGYGPYTDNAPQNKWSATAVSVGPDGTVHLLWNNTDHRVMLWSVAPDFSFSLAGYGPYTDNAPGNLWSATALSTGPDGVSHILWNNTDNRVMLWNVAPSFSFTLAGYGPYTDGAPQNLWSAAGLSVGPDNVQHILWTNTDRRAMFWNVDSGFGFTLAGFGPYTDNAPGNLWTATALATGPDGLSHILWDNTDNRAMLWGVDSAFNFTVAGYGPYTDNAPGNLWSATAVSAGP